jgi:hypothetical protein
MLQAFILKLLVEAVKNPEIRKFIADQIDQLKDDLLPDIVATFPTFVAAALKVFSDKIPNVEALTEDVGELATSTAKTILDSDPDLPVLSNIIDLSEMAKRWLHL